jgi:hypothetical protein
MNTRMPPQFEPPPLEMTLDGRFREPPAAPITAQIGRVALVVAALATVGAVALLALWFALVLIPVAVGAGLIAWGILRFQQWRGVGPFARFSAQFRR